MITRHGRTSAWVAVAVVMLQVAACTRTSAPLPHSERSEAKVGKPDATTGPDAGARPVFRGDVPIVRGLERQAEGTFVVLEVQVQKPQSQAMESAARQLKPGDSFEWGGDVYVVKGVLWEVLAVQLERNGKAITISVGYTIMNQPMTMPPDQPSDRSWMRLAPNAPAPPRVVSTPGAVP